MAVDPFYRPVDPAPCQGDIVEDVPHVFLRPPLLALRRIDLPRGRKAMGYYEYPPPDDRARGGAHGEPLPGGPFRFTTEEGEEAAGACRVARAILLNHDCDLENEPNYCVVGLVRPLEGVQDPEHRAIIQDDRNYSRFYLPPHAGIPESYVDFRWITSLSPVFIARGRRIASLTPQAVQALQTQLFRFFTHPPRDLGPPAGQPG